ncbi:hypothetical protein Ga0100231_017310 [Opitutaceae bacterium TAV4]|nr:hypothetical protein Ga0100231_017310 [Opitutaceae bacterium TAV4]
MNMNTRISIIVGMLASVAFCTTLPAAAPAVVEDFSYENGSLYNRNGGSGFSNAWSNSATGWTVSNGAASISSTTETSSTRTLQTPITAAGDGHFYFSFTLTTDAYSTSTTGFTDYLVFRDGGTTVFNVGSEKPAAYNYRLQARAGGSNLRLSDIIADPTGMSNLIVGKFVFNDGTGKAVLSLWLNPASGSNETLTTYTLTWSSTVTQISGIQLIRYVAAGNTSATESFDSIRIGSDWKSVTSPIPEPSTYAVIFGAFVFGSVVFQRFRN